MDKVVDIHVIRGIGIKNG